jgi:hypothetical protein
MKIAVLVPDEVFEAGEHLARQLGICLSARGVDRQLLTQRVRAVPGTTMRQVDEGLRLIHGL